MLWLYGMIVLQESCAIANMTAQCTLYMGALKIFGTNYAHGSQIMGFCSDRVIGPMNVLTKFEVRS